MKHTAVPALARARMASVTLAILLFGLELLLMLLLLLLVYLRAAKVTVGLDWMLLPVAATFVANSWALGRAVKTSHFTWLYGRWPEVAALPAGGQEQDQVLAASRHAFLEGEFARVPGLLARLDKAGREDALALAQGRALALDGRTQEAAEALQRLGSHEEGLRRLKPQSYFGLVQAGPYFNPGDALWARRGGLLALVGAGLLLLGAVHATLFYQGANASVAKLWQGFDGKDFTVESAGPFTVHFHDPAFRDLALPVAQEALEQQLAFFGLPADTFAPGQIKLYLCDTREEYVRRAPLTPEWEAGSAQPKDNAIYFYRMDPKQAVYFEIVVAHELTHLVYHKLVPDGRNDAWLNEGLAEHMGYYYAFDKAGIPRQAWLMDNSFAGLRAKALPFKAFFATDPHDLPDSRQVSIFYKQGFSVVYMLLEHFGREPFLQFLKAYGSLGNMDQALKRAYPSIRDVDELSAVWGLFFPVETATPKTVH